MLNRDAGAEPFNYGMEGASAPQQPYSWWTDPDTPPPAWMLDPRTPPIRPGGGYYWNWAGDHWEQLAAPTAGPSTTPNTGPIGPGPVPTTYGGGGGDSIGKGTGQFDYGRPAGNRFTPYQPLGYEKFSFGDFTPTNREDLWNDQLNPGFKRSQERLQKQIEAGAAYQGMLRSGMTFDRLGSILGNNEETQFKNFDDRRFRDWGANRANRFGAWEANTGLAERENQRSNDFRFNTENADFNDMLSRWQELVRSTTQLARPV